MLPAPSVTNHYSMAAWPLKKKTLGSFLNSGTIYQTTSHPRRTPSPTASLRESQIAQEIRDLAMKHLIVTSKVHFICRFPRNELPHIILPNILAKAQHSVQNTSWNCSKRLWMTCQAQHQHILMENNTRMCTLTNNRQSIPSCDTHVGVYYCLSLCEIRTLTFRDKGNI